MDEIFNYFFYAKEFFKIKTKLQGLRALKLRRYQIDFIDFWQDISGPARIIALKPRQAGFSTIVSSKFTHEMCTAQYFSGLVMADKKSRTQAIKGIYDNYLENLPPSLMPQLGLNNTEKLELSGLRSGISYETANDPNAGRSESRKFAHLSEAAFYRYADEIDEGVQNSIPLAHGTTIVKESTANGRAGIGKPFYDLWQAAKRKESIYKPFFVAWFEVDDYFIRPEAGFRVTKYERDILNKHPSVTEANLAWRRLKVMEYREDDDNQIMSAEERFKQDFPLDDDEAFRSTGAPVFDPDLINKIINQLNNARPKDLRDSFKIKGSMIDKFKDRLKVFSPPRNEEYFLGADVAEGLAIGDASSVFVMNKSFVQVASWHGKIDPDLFGHLIIEIAQFFNNAFCTVEKNNMGHTTVTTMRNEGYSRVYKKVIEDKQTKEKTTQLGWTTTSKSKNSMINEGIKLVREGEIKIRDIRLVEEMGQITRGENGVVSLNGRDRVVAYCLALMGRKHFSAPIHLKPKKLNSITGTGEEITEAWERDNRQKNDDIFS